MMVEKTEKKIRIFSDLREKFMLLNLYEPHLPFIAYL